MLLPRVALPLSALDLLPLQQWLPRSRLFEAHVKILELEDRMGSQPIVLVAKDDHSRTLYAVEREDCGLYAICQLGSWVDVARLKAAALVVKQQSRAGFNASGPDMQKVPVETVAARKESLCKRLAIEALQATRRPSVPFTQASAKESLEQPMAVPAEQIPIAPESISGPAETPPTEIIETRRYSAAEFFDNIRDQYLEALYLSRATLAYFVKGPLSRARAAFHLDFDASLDMKELVAFLETMIMSSTILDKKYKDSLAACVADIDLHDHSADEASRPAQRRKSSKKMKLGKGGMYSTEDRLVRQWWSAHGTEADCDGFGQSRDELMRSRISQLRTRETQLQIILILEILALRPLLAAMDDAEGLPVTAGDSSTKSQGGVTRSRKSEQLSVLMDLHLDRLCIWQSISSVGKHTPGNQDVNTTALPDSIANKPAENHLRDFCVEVIIPL